MSALDRFRSTFSFSLRDFIATSSSTCRRHKDGKSSSTPHRHCGPRTGRIITESRRKGVTRSSGHALDGRAHAITEHEADRSAKLGRVSRRAPNVPGQTTVCASSAIKSPMQPSSDRPPLSITSTSAWVYCALHPRSDAPHANIRLEGPWQAVDPVIGQIRGGAMRSN